MVRATKAATAAVMFLMSGCLFAQPQTVPGAGNAAAANIAQSSRIVASAMDFLVGQAKSLSDPTLRMQTLDAISNVNTCVMHRANLTDAAKDAILTALKNQGLVRTSDDATFPGGLKAG